MISALINRRKRGERGAILVEAAVVFPVLFALFSAFIDFAWALNDLQTTRQETREVARAAAVDHDMSDLGCSHSAGTVSDATKGLICSVKDRVGDTARVKLVLPDTTHEYGDTIRLCVQTPYDSLTGVYSDLIDHRVAQIKVETRAEMDPDQPLEAFSESAPSGHDWSFCS